MTDDLSAALSALQSRREENARLRDGILFGVTPHYAQRVLALLDRDDRTLDRDEETIKLLMGSAHVQGPWAQVVLDAILAEYAPAPAPVTPEPPKELSWCCTFCHEWAHTAGEKADEECFDPNREGQRHDWRYVPVRYRSAPPVSAPSPGPSVAPSSPGEPT